jgi:hypothetical protein
VSYKKATYVFLAAMIVLAGFYFRDALAFQDNRFRGSIGPGYFPIGLAVTLLVLCVISMAQTAASADRQIDLPNLGYVGGAVALTAAFLFAWSLAGYFYLLCFIYLVALLTLFADKRGLRQVAVNVAVAAVVTSGVYGLFGLVIEARF